MELNKYALDTHTKYALNANTLKLIAALAMFFDHFAAVFFPLLILYNGKRGKKSKFMTRFFYVFYPLHLLFIYVLRLCADSLIG